MKKSAMVVLLTVAAAMCAWSAGKTDGGAAYPTKPITVLQGFAAGGGSDQLAQLTQPFLQKILGQSFVNQYIPGATGAIAWTQLA
jgi:tripartite-type tricarboxylate transporter receptor subunit TctC